MSRQQRHEIIKYVRSRLPIFLIQTHQFLQNIMCILANLTDDEKTELVVFLVPEVSYVGGCKNFCCGCTFLSKIL